VTQGEPTGSAPGNAPGKEPGIEPGTEPGIKAVEARSRHRIGQRVRIVRRRARRLPPAVRGMMWMILSGMMFSTLNALLRKLTLSLDPLQAQFLRYLFGVIVMMPLVLRYGWRYFQPQNLRGQFLRGVVHTTGLGFWFVALPHIALADMTSIGFTGPIFVMIGAALFLREPMRWDRWLAAIFGLSGILIVVGPKLAGTGGIYNLVMLASAPMFAASFLITKALTRYETAPTIVLWQSITVAVLSFPFSLLHWKAPTTTQWFLFLLAGVLGSVGHYCLTRAFTVADISATQSVKFLDLIWATLLGWLLFADQPSEFTLVGGSVICAATIWIARREARQRKLPAAPKPAEPG
jgi:drug/metabolite transporter (DMT)-like permease